MYHTGNLYSENIRQEAAKPFIHSPVDRSRIRVNSLSDVYDTNSTNSNAICTLQNTPRTPTALTGLMCDFEDDCSSDDDESTLSRQSTPPTFLQQLWKQVTLMTYVSTR